MNISLRRIVLLLFKCDCNGWFFMQHIFVIWRPEYAYLAKIPWKLEQVCETVNTHVAISLLLLLLSSWLQFPLLKLYPIIYIFVGGKPFLVAHILFLALVKTKYNTSHN